jgi:hypothetical protein
MDSTCPSDTCVKLVLSMMYILQGDCMYIFPGNNNTSVELLMIKKVI